MKKIILAFFIAFISLSLIACNGVRREDVGAIGGGVAGGVIGSSLTGGSTAGTIAGTIGGAYAGSAIARSTR